MKNKDLFCEKRIYKTLKGAFHRTDWISRVYHLYVQEDKSKVFQSPVDDAKALLFALQSV